MTRHDFLVKWGVYALALLPIWFLEAYLLPHFPILGVKPVLLPLATVAAAVLEGAAGGAGFGLGVGLLSCFLYPDANGGFVAVFGIDQDVMTIPLPTKKPIKRVKCIYPDSEDCRYSVYQQKLTVALPQKKCARLFEFFY